MEKEEQQVKNDVEHPQADEKNQLTGKDRNPDDDAPDEEDNVKTP